MAWRTDVHALHHPLPEGTVKTSKTLLSLAVASFLVACGGGGESSTPAAETAQPAAAPATQTAAAPAAAAPTTGGPDGAAEYLVCSACHQANGQGLPGAFPPLAGSEVVTGEPSIPIAIILKGLQGELTVKGQKYNGVMASWAQLSDAQIAAILTYERSSWGNAGSAVTAEQVAKVRAATASRTTPWTWAEVSKVKLN